MSDSEALPPAKRPKLDEDGPSSQESEKKYENQVTPEELEKLREFQVLDEVKSDDESQEEGSDKSDVSDDEKSEELPDEEIEKMLEEDLPETFKGAPKQVDRKYVRRKKIVLEEKGINHFEVLPLDWMMVRHCSGMPIYMHRTSRVCTLAKPYFLGKGNTRRHDIPISAIPCLAYRVALKEEEKQAEIDRRIAEQIKNGTWANQPPPPTTTEIHSNQTANSQSTENGDSQSNHTINEDSSAMNGSENPDPKPCEFGEKSSETEMKVNKNNFQEIVDSNAQCLYKQTYVHPVLLNVNHVSKPSVGPPELPIDEPVDEQNKEIMENISQEQESQSTENIQLNLEQQCPFNSQQSSMNPQDNSQLKQSISQENSQVNSEDISMNSQNSVDNSQAKAQEISDDMYGHPSARPVVLPGGLVMAPPRVETVNTSWKSQQLDAQQINDYCKPLFKFKEVNIMHFKRWADRRKYTKARKTMQYPTLPEGTKLITIPAHAQEPGAGGEGGAGVGGGGGGKAAKRDWVMNMNGCSYLSVFHEYVRRALHKQPVYEFKQLENATSPYQATVYIGGMQYGVGRGSSKRQAKSQAARASIHILIPEMRDELPTGPGDLTHTKEDPDFTFFDYVSIEDPRIQEFCGAAAEPSPHAILRTCLLRNCGAGDRHIHVEMKKLEFQKIELTMRVGKHTATVVCKNKKQAKQRASQTILQQLHPHITSWGSLLRLYGSRSMKSCKEKKLEEQQITLLQDKAEHNEPNHAVLEKLREEMRKLKERDGARAPIGTLRVRASLPEHSASNLNNVDL